MSFFNKREQKARKEHICGMCKEKIKKGNIYITNTGTFQGDFFHEKSCLKCGSVELDYLNTEGYDPDNGYDRDSIRDYWNSYKCDICKHRKRNRYRIWDCAKGNMTHYIRCENYELLEG